jgi:MSHA pilin protein MshA
MPIEKMRQPKSARNRLAGFSLLELAIVVAIIGALAAILLQKLIELQRDMRIAKLQAARGATLAAAALIHAGYLARGNVADTVVCKGGGTADNAPNGTLCTENGLVQMANGYPSGAVALGAAIPGIVGVVGLVSAFSPTLAQLNAAGYGATIAGATTTLQVTGGSSPATCSFTYTSPAAAGAAPAISVITTTGC